jgi:DNA-binding transcriptional ArsR family regulator
MTTAQLEWDIGTAYDMLVSLHVLHDPNKYGLRGSWAAGVRSRLPNPEREILQQLMDISFWGLHWIYTLPGAKNGRSLLEALQQLEARERISTLGSSPYMPDDMLAILHNTAERGSYNDEDVTALTNIDMGEHRNWTRKRAIQTLDVWSDPVTYGEGLLSGLQEYHDAFFAEEENRIQAPLENALAEAQALAATSDVNSLLEALSQGLRFPDPIKADTVVLAPSFWATPLVVFVTLTDNKDLFLFGGRPSNMSLVPGEQVPDALYQALKALADPTRLRILRYLADRPMTPAELSRRLRLRAPTVIHHLHALRLARLVHLTLGEDGKRYELRRQAVMGMCTLLGEFLEENET